MNTYSNETIEIDYIQFYTIQIKKYKTIENIPANDFTQF